jgi:hypothetical protein
MIINRKKTSSQTITKLLYKNKSYMDKANIAYQLNTHYINIGHDLAEKLPKSPINTRNSGPWDHWSQKIFYAGRKKKGKEEKGGKKEKKEKERRKRKERKKKERKRI